MLGKWRVYLGIKFWSQGYHWYGAVAFGGGGRRGKHKQNMEFRIISIIRKWQRTNEVETNAENMRNEENKTLFWLKKLRTLIIPCKEQAITFFFLKLLHHILYYSSCLRFSFPFWSWQSKLLARTLPTVSYSWLSEGIFYFYSPKYPQWLLSFCFNTWTPTPWH